MKKGFTLIELLAIIVILAIIALIVTPVVSNIVANARIAANARSVEGHIRNIELAIISRAFASETTGDTDAFDTITSGTVIEASLSKPDNDNVVCTNYSISHGKVMSASGCKVSNNSWNKTYSYSSSNGATVEGSESGGNEPEQVAETWDQFYSITTDYDYIDDATEVDTSWDIWSQANSTTGVTEACAKFSGGTACMKSIDISDYEDENGYNFGDLETQIRNEFESRGATCTFEDGILCNEGLLVECFYPINRGRVECYVGGNGLYPRYCFAPLNDSVYCEMP